MGKPREMSDEDKIKAEQKKAKLREFIDQISKMSDEELFQLKQRINIITCDGHGLSLKNTALLDLQAKGIGKTVSVIGGFQQWLDKGRVVRKGEKAFTILVPSEGKAKDEAGNETPKMFFRFVSVFDISQTDEVSLEESIQDLEQLVEI